MEEKWNPFAMGEEWNPLFIELFRSCARRLNPLPQDIDHAVSLLGWSTEKPHPTEREGRAALARILYSQAQAMYQGRDNVPGAFAVIFLLAGLFGAKDAPRRVVFKNANKRSRRSWDIAAAMHALCEKDGYDKAAEKAAEMLGLSDRHVKRAYAKHKGDLR
jgi:hypothetical protein